MDECNLHVSNMELVHGYSTRGLRCIGYRIPPGHGLRLDILAAISQDGLVAVQIYSGGPLHLFPKP